MSEVTQLNLDNIPVKTLKGLENFSIEYISANNCEIDTLDGIRDIEELRRLYLDGNSITELGDVSGMWYLEEIDLRNNNLEKIEDLGELLAKDTINQIKIEGNPIFDEAVEYMFYEYYKPVSIIGNAGDSAFQKTALYPLGVDLDNMVLTFSNLIDAKVPELEFEIEDTAIATIGENYEIERNRPFESNFPDKSTVLRVDLLETGKTRMKITCGEFVRYTDIMVLPEGNQGVLKIELDSISDENFVYAFDEVEKTYSGIVSYEKLSEMSTITVDATKGAISAFESLADFGSLKSLVLSGYSQEQLDAITGLNNTSTITDLDILNGNISSLKFNDNLPALEKLVATGSGIENVDVSELSENLKYIDLRNNKITNLDDLNIPGSVNELYLEGNPLNEDVSEKIFEKYMFNDDIYGEVDTYVPFDMKVDVILDTELNFEVVNEEIAERRGDSLKLSKEGITVMKVSYGSVSKLVTVISGSYDEFLPGDVNGDKIRSAEDALGILKKAAKLIETTDFIDSISDMNADEIVNAEDALAVLKAAAKI